MSEKSGTVVSVTVPVLDGWQGYAKAGVRNAMVIAIAMIFVLIIRLRINAFIALVLADWAGRQQMAGPLAASASDLKLLVKIMQITSVRKISRR